MKKLVRTGNGEVSALTIRAKQGEKSEEQLRQQITYGFEEFTKAMAKEYLEKQTITTDRYTRTIVLISLAG